MVGTAGAMQYYQDVTPMEDGGSTNESDSWQWTLGTGSRWSVPRNQECWSLHRKGNKTLLSNAYGAQKWKYIFSEHTLILLSVLSSFAEDNQSWLKPLNPIRPGPFQLTRRPGGGCQTPLWKTPSVVDMNIFLFTILEINIFQVTNPPCKVSAL